MAVNKITVANVPPAKFKKWKESLDVLTEVGRFPAALVDIADEKSILVYAASSSEKNPFTEGAEIPYGAGAFCDQVIASKKSLLIENASDDPKWALSPAVRLGFKYYYGLPIHWPDGSIFGTICVLDIQPRENNSSHTRLLEYFRDSMELDLSTLAVEHELRKSEGMLRNMIESSLDCAKIVDLEARLVSMNASGCRQMEIDDFCAFQGADWLSFWEEPARTLAAKAMSLAKAGQVGRFEAFCKTAKGSPKWWDVIVTPIIGGDGNPEYVLSVSRDITKRKAAEESLRLSELESRKAKEAAERAHETKAQFLANMSHEIRTPMNAIIGFTDLLQNSEVDEADRVAFLNRIKSNGDQLLCLIDDILDIAKFEAGKFPVEKSHFSLNSLLTDVAQSLRPIADRKAIQIHSKQLENIEMYSDPVRVRQIFMNIIGNAIKFSDSGVVEVRLAVDSTKQQVLIEVEDNGIGIAAEDQLKLFQPFSQADGSISRRFGGSGLGLTLSRHLSRALGGDLLLKSSLPKKGSCFIVCLGGAQVSELSPSQTVKSSENISVSNEHKRAPQLEGAKVLLAEDSADNEALMRIILHAEGAEVDVARDGLEAVTLSEKGDYDLILMDIQMPRLDGLSAARLIRANGFEKPIIALTAHVLKEEVRKSLQAGCNGHLSKPVNRQQLISTIKNYIETFPASELIAAVAQVRVAE